MDISIIFHAAIIGFMVFFSAVVAPSVFKTLSQNAAGAFLRMLFVRMFVFGLVLALVAAGVALYNGSSGAVAVLSLAIAAGFGINAFIITPVINRYRDRMLDNDLTAKQKFALFHFISVAIFLTQLLASSYILVTALI